ncbi:FecR domain-containing protein [Propionivibrio sp.]|uniref:FecR domain-containing protein n=1 Tax=Propionivibrio sp. TaxID=2212460 RepID=UPI003BEFE180
MINNKLSFASLALMLAWGSLHAAEPAGKVLMLQGTAVAVRGALEVPLLRGTVVETGDLLRVAADSSLQVRFTDESVVALRANTQFKIDEYKFSDKGAGDSSFFSLLKGGMRTITGLIGKRSPDAYQMRGVTATIGIRGTHFTAVSCAADCSNADGSKAEDGLYGSVTDGRIVVRNEAGESEFIRDQYFVVTAKDTLPKALLAPPSFLRDKLDGLVKAKGKGEQGKAAEVTVAGSSGSSSVAETTSPVAGVVPGAMVAAPATNYVPTETPLAVAVITGLSATATNNPWLNFIDLGTWSSKVVRTGPNPGSWQDVNTYGEQVQLDPTTFSANVDWVKLQAAGFFSIADFYKVAFSDTSTDTYGGVTYNSSYTKSASTEIGFSAAAGNVSWGRYTEHEVKNGSDGSVETRDSISHWATSNDLTTAPPTSGIYTYNPIGGTSPTDQNGNVGSMSSRGQWTVNFGAKTMGTSLPITWSIAGSAYSVSVPSQTYQINSTLGPVGIPGGGTYQTISASGGTGLISTTTCSGGSCMSPTTQVSVIPFGAQAQGLGVGLATSSTTGVTSPAPQSISSVQIYQR